MADLLSDEAVASAIEGTDWQRDGDTLVRNLKLTDFRAAIDYVNRVADVAEAANHHPDILVHGFNKVRMTVSTHSAGGLTQADLDLIAAIDEIPTLPTAT